MIENGLSIDADELISTFSDSYDISLDRPYEKHIYKQIDYILRLLKEIDIFATFFINGKSVRDMPEVIKKIHDAGHEIACHGYTHKYIQQYKDRREFEEDLEKCIELIYAQIHVKPIGYRAPGLTLFFNKDMVLDALKKYGFLYDSSVTSWGTVKYHGYKRLSSDGPFKWKNGILELPLSSSPFRFCKIPAFGSYFLRIFPLFLTNIAMERLNKKNINVFFYFHPFELFKVKYPKEIMNKNFPFAYGYNLFSGPVFRRKLKCILNRYKFVPYRELFEKFIDAKLMKEPVFVKC